MNNEIKGKLPETSRPTIATRFSDQTGVFFRYFSPANSKSFWQHVDMNDGRGAQVGPQYRSKDELLADSENYLRRAGWLIEDGKMPQTRLWVALVEHETVPGTRPVLIAQTNEPDDSGIFARFSEEADSHELKVVGVFDLSHVIGVDASSKEALAQYVRSAAVEASVKQSATTPKAPSMFDTMVPWGLSRSPIVPSM